MTDERLDELERLADAATIYGASAYRVTRDGVVWSVGFNWRGKGQRPLRPVVHNGYHAVRLILTDGKRIRRFVHQLVAAAFVPRPKVDIRLEIRHLDGNPLNNRADNLAWGTQADNAADRERHGRTARGDRNGMRTQPAARPTGLRNGSHTKPDLRIRGEKNGNAKFTEATVRYARQQAQAGRSATEISAELGIALCTVCRVIKRKAWTHVE